MGTGNQQPKSIATVQNDTQTVQSDYSDSTQSITTATTSKEKKEVSRSGVIQNFTAGPDERTFLDRILDSLFLGVSYNGRNNLFMTEFQLYENWNSGYSASSLSPQATRIVYYGKVAQGRPVENNDVTVYGIFDNKKNFFIAERIINQTDGTYANFMPQKISATIIRVIVVSLLLAILTVAFTVFTGGFSGGSGEVGASSSGTGGGLQQILLGLATIVAGAGAIIWSRVSRNSRFRVPLIGVGALLVLVGIFIMSVQDLDGKFSLLKSEVLSVVVIAIVLRIGVSLFISAILKTSNPTVEKILNWVTVILIVLTIWSAVVNIFLM